MIPSTWSPFEIPYMDSFPEEYDELSDDDLEFFKQSKSIILAEDPDEFSLTSVSVNVFPVDGMELLDFMITETLSLKEWK